MLIMGSLVFLKQHLLDIELIRLLRASQQSFQELQLLQTQLVQSEKLASLGQLVGGAAHELNNPLTAMLGYSELLATTNLTSEQRSLAEKVSQQAKRIRILVASLLSFAKQVDVHPGLVVGQIHSRTGRYDFLRRYLVKIRQFILPQAVTDGWGHVYAT